MAKGVVVRLEPVEVEQDQQRRLALRGHAAGRVELRRQLAPVAEPRQRVMQCLMLVRGRQLEQGSLGVGESLLGLHLGCHVGHDPVHEHALAVTVRACTRVHPPVDAVVPANPIAHLARPAGLQALPVGDMLVPVVGVDEPCPFGGDVSAGRHGSPISFSRFGPEKTERRVPSAQCSFV